MKEMNNVQVKGSGWKCLASCAALCLTDTASPVMDVAGYVLGAASMNA